MESFQSDSLKARAPLTLGRLFFPTWRTAIGPIFLSQPPTAPVPTRQGRVAQLPGAVKLSAEVIRNRCEVTATDCTACTEVKESPA